MFKDPTPKKVGFFIWLYQIFFVYLNFKKLIMYFRKDMLEVGPDLYLVKRRFKIELFQKVIDRFGPKMICENYHADKILRGADGYFYLVDLVEEAKII
jgi:hypothetical protein